MSSPARYQKKWDVFISYAVEDRAEVAGPLAEALTQEGLRVWFDEIRLRIGDSLSRAINEGLSASTYGVVILSPTFLSKEWPQKELAALVSRERDGRRIILPVWHNLGPEDLVEKYPILADRVAIRSSAGLQQVVRRLIEAMELPFGGRNISGLWSGNTGRLRLFPVKNGAYEGDYDWQGHRWTGHIHGTYVRRVLRFSWWWELSSERGTGFFVYAPFDRDVYYSVELHGLGDDRLIGGWVFDTDGANLDCSEAELLRLPHLRRWHFTRSSPGDRFPGLDLAQQQDPPGEG